MENGLIAKHRGGNRGVCNTKEVQLGMYQLTMILKYMMTLTVAKSKTYLAAMMSKHVFAHSNIFMPNISKMLIVWNVLRLTGLRKLPSIVCLLQLGEYFCV
jgi:hypothetical protein